MRSDAVRGVHEDEDAGRTYGTTLTRRLCGPHRLREKDLQTQAGGLCHAGEESLCERLFARNRSYVPVGSLGMAGSPSG